MLQVLVDGGVEVFGVALVQTVDLSFWLDLHISFSQDELAKGLKKSNTKYRCHNPRKNITQV